MTWHPGAGEPLTVDLGVDCYRDASAVVRAYANGDCEGAYAVLTGTDAPRHLAAALATVVVMVAKRGGLNTAQITEWMNDITSDVTDAILDHCAPAATTEVPDA